MMLQTKLENSQDNREQESLTKSIRRVKRQLWHNVGLREKNLDSKALKAVIDKQKQFSRVPEGYLYPELILV